MPLTITNQTSAQNTIDLFNVWPLMEMLMSLIKDMLTLKSTS